VGTAATVAPAARGALAAKAGLSNLLITMPTLSPLDDEGERAG
jgi:hypothetical protein